MASKVKWRGSKPSKCDLCGTDLKEATCFYDFRTVHGSWALGCEVCFTSMGCGLGTGKGQKYSITTLEKINEVPA